MYGHTRLEITRYEMIVYILGRYWYVICRGKDDKKNWLGDLDTRNRSLEALMRRVDYMVFSLMKRSKGKPGRTFEEIINKWDLTVNNISENLLFN